MEYLKMLHSSFFFFLVPRSLPPFFSKYLLSIWLAPELKGYTSLTTSYISERKRECMYVCLPKYIGK